MQVWCGGHDDHADNHDVDDDDNADDDTVVDDDIVVDDDDDDDQDALMELTSLVLCGGQTQTASLCHSTGTERKYQTSS